MEYAVVASVLPGQLFWVKIGPLHSHTQVASESGAVGG